MNAACGISFGIVGLRSLSSVVSIRLGPIFLILLAVLLAWQWSWMVGSMMKGRDMMQGEQHGLSGKGGEYYGSGIMS